MTCIVTNKLTPNNQKSHTPTVKLTSACRIYRENWENRRRENYAIFASVRSAASLFPPSEIDASSLASHDPSQAQGADSPVQGQAQSGVMIANSAVTLSTWHAAPSYPNEKNMVYVLCVLSSGAGNLLAFALFYKANSLLTRYRTDSPSSNSDDDDLAAMTYPTLYLYSVKPSLKHESYFNGSFILNVHTLYIMFLFPALIPPAALEGAKLVNCQYLCSSILATDLSLKIKSFPLFAIKNPNMSSSICSECSAVNHRWNFKVYNDN